MEFNQEFIDRVQNSLDADILVYTGPINYSGAQQIFRLIKKKKRKNLLLFLVTFGGDPHAAYKIARIMQNKYEKFILYVSGVCKSAGTLLAVGSDLLIMSDAGELGPLDMQVIKEDKFNQVSSLDISKSITCLKSEVIKILSETFDELKKTLPLIHFKNPVESILKAATDVACSFIRETMPTIGIERIGEIQRALETSFHYGIKLINNGRGNISDVNQLLTLVGRCPDHALVIEIEEAKKMLKEVSEPTDILLDLEENLFNILNPSPIETLYNNLIVLKLNKEDTYEKREEKSEPLPITELNDSGKRKK